MTLKLGLILALAIIAGVIGWRAIRRRRRSIFDEKAPGVTDAEYERLLERRLVRRRLGVTVIYAAVGALLGWVIGLMPMFR
jgi:hypothetical protein